MRFASVLIIASVRAFAPTPSPRHSHKLVLRAGDEPNVVTKGAWFAAELAGKAKAALGGPMERGPTMAAPKSPVANRKRVADKSPQTDSPATK